MSLSSESSIATRPGLRKELNDIGVMEGDHVLVHAGLRSVGPILSGPDALISALIDAVGPGGTILAYCDWQQPDGLHPDLRSHVLPFDPARSRSVRENGAFPEFLRTTPGAKRSGNPGASFAALGARADWFTNDHALDYGYGPLSPLGKLVEAEGKTLLLGAPKDTMTLLHHAEHLAAIPGKRVIHYDVPLLDNGHLVWRAIEEFDTGEPIVEGLAEDYFGDIVTDYLAIGKGRTGQVGKATAILVEARGIVEFAIGWLEARFPLA